MSWRRSVYEDMSKAEIMVSDFLYELDWWWEYETGVYIKDEKERPRLWTPDFYLPELGIYIEVVGNVDNNNYTYREKMYLKNKIPIIFIYPHKDRDWQQTLIDRCWELHQGRWEMLKRIVR